MMANEPSYIRLYEKGLLKSKAAEAASRLKSCRLCPRKCGVDRLSGETGFCNTGKLSWVSSVSPHFGEEAPLVGNQGSGTIFFAHCNLLCLFCQNFDISHQGQGQEITAGELAGIMLSLQNQGCHNINFVTPSHVAPQILAAVEVAVPQGLNLPLVFNTGGYDRVTTLKLLEGVFDIYMPDFKFWDAQVAENSCQAADYPQVARKALVEMHRQVGDLLIDAAGIARRGLLIRHLVYPEDLREPVTSCDLLPGNYLPPAMSTSCLNTGPAAGRMRSRGSKFLLLPKTTKMRFGRPKKKASPGLISPSTGFCSDSRVRISGLVLDLRRNL